MTFVLACLIIIGTIVELWFTHRVAAIEVILLWYAGWAFRPRQTGLQSGMEKH